jgi:ethanolamine utilization protein EutN
MRLARVVGSAVASVKEPRMTGMKLLLVEDAGADGKPAGPAYVAADMVGAGETELVIVVTGSPAARAVGIEGVPIDAAIVAIVDAVRRDGKTTYNKD